MYRKAAMYVRKLAKELCGMTESTKLILRYIKQCQIF
jgi:hypothetical protein